MLQFCFSLKSSTFLWILSLRIICFYLLPGSAITAGDQWKPEKKNGEGKFGYRETVEMNKMLISAHETSRFFRCYDNHTASLTQFFHAHIKDWQTKIYKIGKPAACSFMKTHLKWLKGFSRIYFFKKQSIKIIRLRKEIELSLFH